MWLTIPRPLAFDSCRVPEHHLLGPRGMGLKQFLETLDGGRIGVAAMSVGLAQGALDEALAYAQERRAFGQPIAKFQAIQMKLADLSTEIEAARQLTYKAAWLKDQGRNFSLTAAQAKLIKSVARRRLVSQTAPDWLRGAHAIDVLSGRALSSLGGFAQTVGSGPVRCGGGGGGVCVRPRIERGRGHDRKRSGLPLGPGDTLRLLLGLHGVPA